MDSDLGEMVFAAEKISKKRLRKGKGEQLGFLHTTIFATFCKRPFLFQLSTWSNGKDGARNIPHGNLKKTFWMHV